MVIIVGNGHGDPNSNLDKAVYMSHCTNNLEKSILPPAMDK